MLDGSLDTVPEGHAMMNVHMYVLMMQVCAPVGACYGRIPCCTWPAVSSLATPYRPPIGASNSGVTSLLAHTGIYLCVLTGRLGLGLKT